MRFFLSERISSDTVRLCLPFSLRLRSTLRPPTVAIFDMKPCALILFLFFGWYVRLGMPRYYHIYCSQAKQMLE